MRVRYTSTTGLDSAIAESILPDRRCIDGGDGWCEACGMEMMEYQMMRWEQQGGDRPTESRCVPAYSASIEAAMEMEDRIAAMSLQSAYYRALLDVVAASIKDRLFHHFDLIHATAKQRCQAALQVLGTLP